MPDPTATVCTSFRVVHRWAARLHGWLALAMLLAPLALEQVMRALGSPRAGATGLIWALLAASPLFALAAFFFRMGGIDRRATAARADGAGQVRVTGPDGRAVYLASDIQRGFVAPLPKGALTELELGRGSSLALTVPSMEEGEKLLASLGLDASRRRCRIDVADQAHRVGIGVGLGISLPVVGLVGLLFVGSFLGMPTPLSASVVLGWLVAQTLFTWASIAASRPPAVVVGADGLLVERPLRPRTFVPFDDVAWIEASGAGLTLGLRDGGVRRIPAGWGASRELVDAVVLRVREELAARAREPLGAEKLAVLGRDGRTLEAWRRDLRRAASPATGYRASALSQDDLEAILEAGVATTDQTIGAAFALREAAPAAAGEKIRIAAERSADERLRIALDGLSRGEEDDAALEEALAAAEKKHATASV